MIVRQPPDNAPMEVRKAYHALSNLEKWGPGPWADEPNREIWKSHGLDCMIIRGPVGAWCGYVGLTKNHPFYGKSYSDIEGIEVHGGLTYANKCDGHICHEHDDGDDPVFWLGFDCSHCWDLMPAMVAYRETIPEMKELHDAYKKFGANEETYRDIEFVKAEVESLAKKLAEVK